MGYFDKYIRAFQIGGLMVPEEQPEQPTVDEQEVMGLASTLVQNLDDIMPKLSEESTAKLQEWASSMQEGEDPVALIANCLINDQDFMKDLRTVVSGKTTAMKNGGLLKYLGCLRSGGKAPDCNCKSAKKGTSLSDYGRRLLKH